MRGVSGRIKIGLGAAMLVALGVSMPQSGATFPGINGKLAWTQQADLWTALPNGASAAKLIDDADHAAWSVDGVMLAFDRQVAGKGEIGTVFADGSHPGNITNNAADDVQPAWSPDNTKIVFASDRVGGEYRLYRMNAGGSDVVALTNGDNLGAGTDDGAPEWSPNGDRIVFHRGNGQGGTRIYSMKADGTDIIPLSGTTSPDGLPYDKLVMPKWSPNGAKIVFAAEAAGCNSRIVVMQANGTNADTLPKNDGCVVGEPTWSPDGTIIFFRLTGGPTGDGLYGYSVAANTLAELVGGGDATSPDWQPLGGSPVTTTTSTTTPDTSSTTSSTTTTTTTTTTVPPPGAGTRPLIVRGGRWYLRNTNSTGVADTVFDYGNPGDFPITGDWDNNGSVTPGVVRDGTWYLRNSNTTGVADVTYAYGNPGDLAVTGDWDGNGTVTAGVVRNGTWYLRNSNTTGVADVTLTYGDPGDTPVAGDWDGSNTDTPGVVRGGTWYLRNSNTTGVADVTFSYGNPADIALAGDWDGNGSSTPGVVRNGTWYLRNSNTTGVADSSFNYGDPGDTPRPWRA